MERSPTPILTLRVFLNCLSEDVQAIELSFISYNNKSVSIGQLLDSADAHIELDPR